MKKRNEHHYKLTATWKGNRGTGTSGVRDYDRNHTVVFQGKPELHLTTDNPAVGDRSKLNPEDLLVTALSSCHLLSYLYVCAVNGIVVTGYVDEATGVMVENSEGGGRFREVTLNPVVKVASEEMISKANSLHHDAHAVCYIANSVNFPVKINPVCHSD